MSSSERGEFNSWYDDIVRRKLIFDLQPELVEYCIMDVTILKEECIMFRMHKTRA